MGLGTAAGLHRLPSRSPRRNSPKSFNRDQKGVLSLQIKMASPLLVLSLSAQQLPPEAMMSDAWLALNDSALKCIKCIAWIRVIVFSHIA